MGKMFHHVPFPSFILAVFLCHSLRGGRTREWGGEGRGRYFSFPFPVPLFSLSSHLYLHHFTSSLGKRNLVQVDARPEKFSYFTRSTWSVLGKEDCHVVLSHQGTAFWLAVRKMEASQEALKKMSCFSYLKPTAQSGGQPVCKGSRVQPVINPLTKKEAPGNSPPSLADRNRTQKRNPTSVQNAGRALMGAPGSWTTCKPTREKKCLSV